jgi:GH15 family glucan-1,4-alpha-glucosidase
MRPDPEIAPGEPDQTAARMRVARSLEQIERCRYPTGLYSAVPTDSEVLVDLYRSVWIRDTIYTLLAFEAVGDLERLRAGVYALLDRVLLRWSYRLDWRIVEGLPANELEYLHPRYHPDGSEIYTELWGLRQDDAVGLTIWALSRWQERFDLFRNDYQDFHLVQKLIWYCDRILVPNIPDNGIWEEEGPTKTIHLSSIAAVAAGLHQAARIGVKDIPDRLRNDTLLKINEMAGRESDHHATDLALLTLVWPLGEDLPVPRSTLREIVQRVERQLAGTRGVVRYNVDAYHTCHDGPPEWTMGFGFLALAWNALGEPDRGRWYLHRLENVATDTGELPESWCRDPEHHQYYNSPLCWSHALHVIAATSLAHQADGPAASPHTEGPPEVVALPGVRGATADDRGRKL